MESYVYGNILVIGMWSFFLELYIPMLIMLRHAPKRKYWIPAAVGVGVLSFPFYWLPMISIGDINISYIIILAVMIAACTLIYKVKPMQLIFGGVASFTFQHFTCEIMFIVFYAIGEETVLSMSQGALIAIYLSVYAVLYTALFLVLHFRHVEVEFDSKHVFSFVFAVVILIVVWLLSQLYPLYDHNSLFYYIYAALLAMVGLFIQLGYPHLVRITEHNKELENEKKNMEQLLDLQAKQQQLSKETTDVLNMKFHDLKNQLLVLESQNADQQKEVFSELKDSLDIYSSFAKTGNEALDIIITQKGLLCISKNIRLTYIIDGQALSFISDTDLTSLFGNILDNAIEALETEEEDFRIIKLYVTTINGFVSVTEENYCHHGLTFRNGRPVSTKNDSSYHGFGTQSIEYICNKYDGNLQISLEDNIFRISILIPTMSENKQENNFEQPQQEVTDGK